MSDYADLLTGFALGVFVGQLLLNYVLRRRRSRA